MDSCLSRGMASTVRSTWVFFLSLPLLSSPAPLVHSVTRASFPRWHLPSGQTPLTVSAVSLIAFSLKQEYNLLKFLMSKQMKTSKATPMKSQSWAFSLQQWEFVFWHKMPNCSFSSFLHCWGKACWQLVILAVHWTVENFMDNST